VTKLEIEAALEAPTAAAVMALPGHLEAVGMSCGGPEQRIVLDHYIDTDDLAFRAAGWALRVRDLGARKLLGMKALRAAEDGLSSREELEEPVAWEGGWNFPEDALEGRVARIGGGAPLERLFGVRQDRTQLHAADEQGLWVEASMDCVRWEADGEAATAYVAELELREGTPEALRALLERLVAQTGWPTAGWSKYEHGMRVAGLA